MNLGHQSLISVILHLLLSLSYVFLSTNFEQQQKSFLLTIIQLIENIFSKNKIKKNILHCVIVRIINLQNNRMFIFKNRLH